MMKTIFLLILIIYSLQLRRYYRYNSHQTNVDSDSHDSNSFTTEHKCRSRDIFFTKSNINTLYYCDTEKKCLILSHDLKTGRLANTNENLIEEDACRSEYSYKLNFFNDMAIRYYVDKQDGVFLYDQNTFTLRHRFAHNIDKAASIEEKGAVLIKPDGSNNPTFLLKVPENRIIYNISSGYEYFFF
jgi:hypothetical protein